MSSYFMNDTTNKATKRKGSNLKLPFSDYDEIFKILN